MHSKKCTSCGSDNDPLLSNCLFCKSPLPVIDLNSIPNEELVMNAAEWVGKLKDGGYIVTRQTNNKWGIGGSHMVQKAEIQGNALRYLSLLEIRASTNINLLSTVNNLRLEYEKNVKKLSKSQRIALGIGIGFIVMVIVLFMLNSSLMNHLSNR